MNKFRSGGGAPKGPPSVTNGGGGFFGKPTFAPNSRPLNPFVEINLPIASTLSEKDLAEIKIYREIENQMKHSIYYLSLKKKKHDIDRYSDKYLAESQRSTDSKIHAIETNIAFFPDELHPVYNPKLAQKIKKQVAPPAFNIVKFDELEKLEKIDENGGEEEPEDAMEPVEEYNEEEAEDETDYNLCYFDPGDEYGDYDEAGGGAGGDYDVLE